MLNLFSLNFTFSIKTQSCKKIVSSKKFTLIMERNYTSLWGGRKLTKNGNMQLKAYLKPAAANITKKIKKTFWAEIVLSEKMLISHLHQFRACLQSRTTGEVYKAVYVVNGTIEAGFEMQ